MAIADLSVNESSPPSFNANEAELGAKLKLRVATVKGNLQYLINT